MSTYDAGMESIRDAERASAGKPVRAVKTGIRKLDNETGGLQGADFVVIAGKSGMGKSALMGGISWHAACAGYPVLVISLEMKRKQWVQRLITDIDFDLEDIDKGIEYRKFRSTGVGANGESLGFTQAEFARIVLANQRLQDMPWLEIHDEDGLTMAQIAARARAFKSKWIADPTIRQMQGTPDNEEPIGLVIIDYLQLVDPASRQFRPREQEVRDIARGHKAMAKNLDWPVMSGSQLNEDEKARSNKRPVAGDVRESKAIYHEADIMLAPYRMAQALLDSKPDAKPGEPAWNAWDADMKAARNHFDLIGLKNRMGRRFTLELYGDMASSSVRDEAPIRRRPCATNPRTC
jgi:replicative DNA helicase